MKSIFVRLAAVILCLMTVFGGLSVYAATPYLTYTYSIDGNPMRSPEAYTPYIVVNSKYMQLPEDLKTPNDLFVDDEECVYIADSGNSCVYVLDQYYKFKFKLKDFINEHGIRDSLNACQGVFVNNKLGKIYVADTENNRIVIFDIEGNFLKVLYQPEADIMPEDTIYKPVALAVDNNERIYVVSSTEYMGIISLDSNGEFQAYIGAQKVAVDPLTVLWRQFQTRAQRESAILNLSTEFNNITIDDEGFIYITTSSVDEGSVLNAIKGKSKDGTYAPVKKLNTAGDDIMNRNGFYPPSGEVSVQTESLNEDDMLGASTVVDVALGEEGTWSIIDQKRQKVFTYDKNGSLLFAFGDKGKQLGNLTALSAIDYQGAKMLLLDRNDNTFTVYNRTEYGDLLISAQANSNNRNYDAAVDDYNAILQRNNNYDAAYIGMGKAYYRAGDWNTAMRYFKIAYDVDNYSNAFKMYRQQWVSKYVLIIPVVVIAFGIALTKFMQYAAKVNKRATLKQGKKNFKEEVLYAFYLIFHPFDGFWDLKHEKRGSVRGGSVYLILTIIAFIYQAVGRAYLYNSEGSYDSALVQVISVVVPLLLWCIANWCLTTLFEGEGSFKDIYIATTYSLAPLPFFLIISTLLTNVMTLAEGGIITLLLTVGYVWAGALIFFGMMVTHDYSLGKNVLTSIGTIVGMVFIMFLGFLFSSLLSRITSFVASIINELSFRI